MSTNTSLIPFDELKANIALYVSPVMKMSVADPSSAQDMIEAGKLIATYKKAVEAKRKELVAPLNEQVKTINAYAGTLSDPLEQAEIWAKSELIAFERKLELQRQVAAKAEQERREKEEAEARAEQERIAAELAEKHRAQLARIEPEAADDDVDFGSDDEVALKEAQAREAAESQAKAEREAAVRAAEAKQREHDINQAKVKNSAKTWDVEILDINKVPDYLVIKTLNKSAALALARAGTIDVAGLRFFQNTSVRFGANTSMGSLTQKG